MNEPEQNNDRLSDRHNASEDDQQGRQDKVETEESNSRSLTSEEERSVTIIHQTAAIISKWFHERYLPNHPEAEEIVVPHPDHRMEFSEVFNGLTAHLIEQMRDRIPCELKLELKDANFVFQLIKTEQNKLFQNLTFSPESGERYTVYNNPYGNIILKHTPDRKSLDSTLECLGTVDVGVKYLTIEEAELLAVDTHVQKVFCAYAQTGGVFQDMLDHDRRKYHLLEVPGVDLPEKLELAERLFKEKKEFDRADEFVPVDIIFGFIEGQTIRAWAAGNNYYQVFQLEGYEQANKADCFLIIEQFEALVVRFPQGAVTGDGLKPPSKLFQLRERKGEKSLEPLPMALISEEKQELKLTENWKPIA